MHPARAVLAAAVALLVAYAVLRASARPRPYDPLARAAAPAPAAAPAVRAPSSGTLRAALRALDRRRAAAYADPSAADPDAWAARSCACRAEDARRLRALARAGLALRGHRTRLLALTLVRAGPTSAVALVTDSTGAYAAVDARGRVRRRWPAAPPRRWRVTLVRVADRWLLGAVARGP